MTHETSDWSPRIADFVTTATARIFIGIVGFLLLGMVGLVTIGFVPSEPRRSHRETRELASWYEFFRSESGLTEHLYLSSKPGKLMFEVDPQTPWFIERMPETQLFGCGQEDEFDDCRFFYLGYAIVGDNDFEHFARAYRGHVATRERFPSNLPLGDVYELDVSEWPGDELHAFRGYMLRPRDDMWAENKMRRKIPILIERPDYHETSGGHVLYLDGHVEFIPYPGKWPMTEKTINTLLELDALGDQ